MKVLDIIEQDAIFGGGGLSGALQGAAGSAVMSGSGSPGCAALGSLVGAAISSSPAPGSAFAGTVAGAAVTNACNNRGGYPGGNPGESGMPSGGSRYWPGGSGGSGGGGARRVIKWNTSITFDPL